MTTIHAYGPQGELSRGAQAALTALVGVSTDDGNLLTVGSQWTDLGPIGE